MAGGWTVSDPRTRSLLNDRSVVPSPRLSLQIGKYSKKEYFLTVINITD